MLKNKNTFLLLLATVFTASAYAQPTLLPAKPVVTNYMEILMITVALLLVVVVWVLANVLMMVSKKAVEHAKSNPKIMMIFVVVMGSMFAKKGFAQTTVAISDTTTQVVSTDFYGGVSYNTFWTMATVISLELLIVFILVLFIKNISLSIASGSPVLRPYISHSSSKSLAISYSLLIICTEA